MNAWEILDDPELLEQLAALEHERWSGWDRYRRGCALAYHPQTGEVMEARWERQALTAYADLTEAERESDRIEARKTLAVIRASFQECYSAADD
jgi:hypothetical protein